VTEGEAVSGWRVESITPHEVSLSGPGGTKTLEPKLDANLVQQPPPQPPAANPGAPGARGPARPAPAAALPARPPGIPPRLPVQQPPRPVRGRVPQ